jgi:polyhydroxybutyrate depolymerase
MRILLVLTLALAACNSPPMQKTGTMGTTGAMETAQDKALVAARPYEIDVPAKLGTQPLPLILLLHGYGVSGLLQDLYFGFMQLADDRRVLVARPDGTLDKSMSRFWNADDACCDFDNIAVDDVAYLNAVVSDVEAHYNVDPRQVYAVGHSNGAFMAHRLACDTTQRFAAIIAFAGDVWKDASRCQPEGEIAVLQVHGDADAMVPYDGNATMPSAKQSVATWAMKNGCTGDLTATGQQLDLVYNLPGAETEVAAYHCDKGAAELWTIHGGGHLVNFTFPDWGNHVFDWLSAHQRK